MTQLFSQYFMDLVDHVIMGSKCTYVPDLITNRFSACQLCNIGHRLHHYVTYKILNTCWKLTFHLTIHLTFYLRLHGIRHMVKDHSDNERKPAATTWATLSN